MFLLPMAHAFDFPWGMILITPQMQDAMDDIKKDLALDGVVEPPGIHQRPFSGNNDLAF